MKTAYLGYVSGKNVFQVQGIVVVKARACGVGDTMKTWVVFDEKYFVEITYPSESSREWRERAIAQVTPFISVFGGAISHIGHGDLRLVVPRKFVSIIVNVLATMGKSVGRPACQGKPPGALDLEHPVALKLVEEGLGVVGIAGDYLFFSLKDGNKEVYPVPAPHPCLPVWTVDEAAPKLTDEGQEERVRILVGFGNESVAIVYPKKWGVAEVVGATQGEPLERGMY